MQIYGIQILLLSLVQGMVYGLTGTRIITIKRYTFRRRDQFIVQSVLIFLSL